MKKHYLKCMALACKALGLKKQEWIYTMRFMAVSIAGEITEGK